MKSPYYIGLEEAREVLAEMGIELNSRQMGIFAYPPSWRMLDEGGYAKIPYIDYASGTREDRPRYRALLEAARKRKLDVVLVWRYDRFARSTQALVQALKEFQSLGVDFISYQENIDTTSPQGEMIFTVMASLAQFESALISDRVKAGMARAKAQGKRISRAPIPKGIQARIAKLHEQGTSIHQISKQLGIGYETAWTYVQRCKQSKSSHVLSSCQ